ncbi:MAG: hypothetical protein AAGC56_03570 [Pseudomonadota bacterium]
MRRYGAAIALAIGISGAGWATTPSAPLENGAPPEDGAPQKQAPPRQEAPATVIHDGLTPKDFAALVADNPDVVVHDGETLRGVQFDTDAYYADVRGVPVAIGLVCPKDADAACGFVTLLASFDDDVRIDAATLNRINYGSLTPYSVKMRPTDGALALSGAIPARGVTADHLAYQFDLFAASYVALSRELNAASGKLAKASASERARLRATTGPALAVDPLTSVFLRGDLQNAPSENADGRAMRKILNDAYGR